MSTATDGADGRDHLSAHEIPAQQQPDSSEAAVRSWRPGRVSAEGVGPVLPAQEIGGALAGGSAGEGRREQREDLGSSSAACSSRTVVRSSACEHLVVQVLDAMHRHADVEAPGSLQRRRGVARPQPRVAGPAGAAPRRGPAGRRPAPAGRRRRRASPRPPRQRRCTTAGTPLAMASTRAIDRPSCSELRQKTSNAGSRSRHVVAGAGQHDGILRARAAAPARRARLERTGADDHEPGLADRRAQQRANARAGCAGPSSAVRLPTVPMTRPRAGRPEQPPARWRALGTRPHGGVLDAVKQRPRRSPGASAGAAGPCWLRRPR